VGFEYVKKGVLVEGQWHAILRMEWVEGSQTLIPWLVQNLGNPDRILQVANQFATCVEDLHAAAIAHGDLQHGNLLIDTHDRLRVIDYDGMFVPSIKDLGSNELGLANYQHPRRSSSDFGPYLDRFSAWLIYGSLLSLAAQPGLWYTFHQEGEEKLLFGKEDFVPPLDAIERLGSLGSPHAEFADVLTEALTSSSSLASVPEFDPRRIPLPEHTQAMPQAPASPAKSPGWWRQHGTQPAETTSSSDEAVQAARLGTGWLRSHEAPLPPVDVSGPSHAAKAMVLVISAVALLSAIAVGVASNVVLGGLVLLTWATAMAAGVWMLWHRSDAAVGRTAANRKAKLAGREVAKQQVRVDDARSARTALDGDERRALQSLENQRSMLPQSSKAEFERQSKDLNKHLTTLQDELNRLDASKAAEARQQLQTLQEQHIRGYMALRRIEPGVIHGIGPALVGALAAHGLRTAADLATTGSYYWSTISGIGPTKSAAINSWYQSQLSVARIKAPQSLPAQQTKALNSKFADQKRKKQAAIDSVGPSLQRIKAAIDAKYTARDQKLTLDVDAVRLDYRRRRSLADATVAKEVTQLQKLEDALLDAQRNLARYQLVSFWKYLTA
jgi:hypothetical protein